MHKLTTNDIMTIANTIANQINAGKSNIQVAKELRDMGFTGKEVLNLLRLAKARPAHMAG